MLLDRQRLAAQGAGGVALVSGEPGIGKTRLLETLAERARDDGWLVLAGRAYELGGMPPSLPFVEALRGYVRTSSAEELAVQLGDAAAIVALMVPQVRDRLGEVSTETSLLPGDGRYRLFAGVADFLQAIAGSAEANGLLVLLDDLHWADQSSLLLLRYLASALRDGRILLAGACRTVELGSSTTASTA